MAIYSMVAMAAMIVSYWGIPFTLSTFHSGFRIEHQGVGGRGETEPA